MLFSYACLVYHLRLVQVLFPYNVMYRLNPLKVRTRRLFLSSSTGRFFSSLSTQPFIELVDNLKKTNKTCTVIESSCGGLISSSLMAAPGSTKVYWYVFISCVMSIIIYTSSLFYIHTTYILTSYHHLIID